MKTGSYTFQIAQVCVCLCVHAFEVLFCFSFFFRFGICTASLLSLLLSKK